MTSQTIGWYQRCQVNIKNSIDRMRRDLSVLQEDIKRAKIRYDFRDKQICEAVKQGKERFDDERFLLKKSSPKPSPTHLEDKNGNK